MLKRAEIRRDFLLKLAPYGIKSLTDLIDRAPGFIIEGRGQLLMPPQREPACWNQVTKDQFIPSLDRVEPDSAREWTVSLQRRGNNTPGRKHSYADHFPPCDCVCTPCHIGIGPEFGARSR
jgi:hypothetical protein